jgi:hypothetical protein
VRCYRRTLPKGANRQIVPGVRITITLDVVKPHAEMIEGTEAWDRFRDAMKRIVKVPKAALPPNPFKQTKKPTASKG